MEKINMANHDEERGDAAEIQETKNHRDHSQPYANIRFLSVYSLYIWCMDAKKVEIAHKTEYILQQWVGDSGVDQGPNNQEQIGEGRSWLAHHG